MNIRTWTGALLLAAFSGLVSTVAPAAEESCSQNMDEFRARAMARIHAENRAALQRQLHETRNALREQARDSFLAQQPAPASGRSSANSAP